MSAAPSIQIDLLPAQREFLQSRQREVAIAGGLGSGKSFADGLKVYQFAIENNGHPHAIVSKTHRQLHDALLPEIQKGLNALHCPFRMRDGDKLILQLGSKETVFHLWSAHNKAYLNWPGFNLAGAVIDEWDTFAEPQRALEYLNDRVRVNCALPQTAITSSPEGYGDFYRRFYREVLDDPTGQLKKQRQLIYACTFDNPHLRAEYIMDQVRSRDPRLALGYLYGQFCSVSGKSVYYRYSEDNYTTKTVASFDKSLPMHWGCDFNIGINATNGHIIENGIAYAVVEFHGKLTFDDVIHSIKDQFPDRKHYFYPDRSGAEQIEMIRREFGNDSCTYYTKPRIKKRVASLHFAISDPRFNRINYFVNPKVCEHLSESLRNQQYDDNEEPDKKGGWDHHTDAVGYFTDRRFPYVESVAPKIYAL